MKKICFVSSSGGHWEELLCLKALAQTYTGCFVTEQSGQLADCRLQPLYTVPQINRKEKGFLLHFLQLFHTAGKILKAENVAPETY